MTVVALAACKQAATSAPALPTSASDKEVSEALAGQIALAEASRSEPGLFARLARPFGPLNLTMGDAAGADDLERADGLQNYAFGASGAAAGVNPAKLANDFHCGPPCAKRRKAELLAALPQAQVVADQFAATKFKVIALWPGALRVDDRVFGGVYHLERTSILGLVVGRLGPPPAGAPSAEAARIETELRGTAATSVVRDEFGGIRLIHRESIGDNEAGLLFLTEAQARAVDGRQLPSGGHYLGVEPVAPGVYFYMRS